MKIVTNKKSINLDIARFIRSISILILILVSLGVGIDRVILQQAKPGNMHLHTALAAKDQSPPVQKSTPVKAVSKPQMTAPKTAKNAGIQNQIGNKDYRASFTKDLFIGDSITESLSFYEFVNDANVDAKLGMTILKANDHLAVVGSMKPANIYIMFGANDIDGVLTDAVFVQRYAGLIDSIQAKSPGSHVYVQSILPVSKKIAAEKPFLNQAHFDQLNALLKQLAAEKGATYINVASVLQNSDESLYEPDGIHFKKAFYPLWLDFLISNAASPAKS